MVLSVRDFWWSELGKRGKGFVDMEIELCARTKNVAKIGITKDAADGKVISEEISGGDKDFHCLEIFVVGFLKGESLRRVPISAWRRSLYWLRSHPRLPYNWYPKKLSERSLPVSLYAHTAK